ncbi:Pleckstrin -like proteiny domain-containing family F member 2, partial [Caligus rogercresseyi]
HHCRKCGAVVCGGCSTHRHLLPSQSSKPIRVCDSCYKTLNANKAHNKNSSNALSAGKKLIHAIERLKTLGLSNLTTPK